MRGGNTGQECDRKYSKFNFSDMIEEGESRTGSSQPHFENQNFVHLMRNDRADSVETLENLHEISEFEGLNNWSRLNLCCICLRLQR